MNATLKSYAALYILGNAFERLHDRVDAVRCQASTMFSYCTKTECDRAHTFPGLKASQASLSPL